MYCVEKIARGILDAIKGTKKTTLFTISSTVPLRVKNKLIIVRLFKTHSLIFFVLDNIGSILVDWYKKSNFNLTAIQNRKYDKRKSWNISQICQRFYDFQTWMQFSEIWNQSSISNIRFDNTCTKIKNTAEKWKYHVFD